VNGNGRADTVMGCHGDETSAPNMGNAIVHTRNAANTGFDTGVALAKSAPAAFEYCGYSTVFGDFNGDSRSDIVMGCYGTTSGSYTNAGSAEVFLSTAP
jgi:FG-GAP repeat